MILNLSSVSGLFYFSDNSVELSDEEKQLGTGSNELEALFSDDALIEDQVNLMLFRIIQKTVLFRHRKIKDN